LSNVRDTYIAASFVINRAEMGRDRGERSRRRDLNRPVSRRRRDQSIDLRSRGGSAARSQRPPFSARSLRFVIHGEEYLVAAGARRYRRANDRSPGGAG